MKSEVKGTATSKRLGNTDLDDYDSSLSWFNYYYHWKIYIYVSFIVKYTTNIVTNALQAYVLLLLLLLLYFI